MIKKILLIGPVFIIICLMLLACGNSNNKQNDADISEPLSSQEQDDKLNCKTEGVEGKASIENVTIDDGQISFQIKNLTTDNKLLSAYLEYARLENGKEEGHYSLDCDVLNIPPNGISDVISFNPHMVLGKEGIIRIKVLVFENDKDNYGI